MPCHGLVVQVIGSVMIVLNLTALHGTPCLTLLLSLIIHNSPIQVLCNRLSCQKCNAAMPHRDTHATRTSRATQSLHHQSSHHHTSNHHSQHQQHHQYHDSMQHSSGGHGNVSSMMNAAATSPTGNTNNNQRSGKHPGDWVCPMCADLNYNSRYAVIRLLLLLFDMLSFCTPT
jgi:hypothetical protein